MRLFSGRGEGDATLYRYVETHSAEPGPLTAQQLDVLVHARNLAPQVSGIGLNTGGQLIAARRFEEAAAVLRQIAYNPHGGDASKRLSKCLPRPSVWRRKLLGAASPRPTDGQSSGPDAKGVRSRHSRAPRRFRQAENQDFRPSNPYIESLCRN
jgi:hypothetical protein